MLALKMPFCEYTLIIARSNLGHSNGRKRSDDQSSSESFIVKTESVSESWGMSGNWSDKLLLVECVI